MNFSNFSNGTLNTQPQECRLQTIDIVLLASYVAMFIIGTAGNLLVVIIFKRILKTESVLNVLIFYLAICDLMSSIVSPALNIYWIITCDKSWHFGLLACKLIPTLSRVLVDISIGILLIMAIHRYRMIVTPLKQPLSKACITKWAMMTVVLSILCQMHYAFALQVVSSGACQVPDILYLNYSVPTVALILVRILVFLFIVWTTAFAARRALNKSRRFSVIHEYQGESCEFRQQMTKMILFISIIFTVTVIPREMLHVIYTLSYLTPGPGVPYTQVTLVINKALKWLQTSNCIYNVFVYCKLHPIFLYKLVRIVKNRADSCDTISDNTSRARLETIELKTDLLSSSQEPIEAIDEMRNGHA